MKKLLFIILQILIFIPLVYSKKQSTPGVYHGKLFAGIGGAFFDFYDLNSRLNKTSYPSVGNEYLHFGANYQLIYNKVITDFEYYKIAINNNRNDTYKTSLQGEYGFVNIGFLVVSARHFQLYPLVGVGGGTINLEITQEGEFSFDNILQNSQNIVKMSKSGAVINIGLGADFIISVDKKKSSPAFLIGIRGGYTYDTSGTEWTANGLAIDNGPAVGLSGFYVRLMLGMWE